jgi:hypothetical protein
VWGVCVEGGGGKGGMQLLMRVCPSKYVTVGELPHASRANCACHAKHLHAPHAKLQLPDQGTLHARPSSWTSLSDQLAPRHTDAPTRCSPPPTPHSSGMQCPRIPRSR